MRRALFVAVVLAAAAGAGHAAAPAPSACATVSQADAEKWLGTRLPALHKTEQKPEANNGGDHATSCGWFAKGYDLKTAVGPPASGLLVQLHAMPDAVAATRFYEAMTALAQSAPPGAPAPATKPLAGVGEAALFEPIRLPRSKAKIVRISFRQKNVAGSVQVWSTTGAVDDIAQKAAAQVVSRLP